MKDFITLTLSYDMDKVRVNIGNILSYSPREQGSRIHFSMNDFFHVNESVKEIDELIRKLGGNVHGGL